MKSYNIPFISQNRFVLRGKKTRFTETDRKELHLHDGSPRTNAIQETWKTD